MRAIIKFFNAWQVNHLKRKLAFYSAKHTRLREMIESDYQCPPNIYEEAANCWGKMAIIISKMMDKGLDTSDMIFQDRFKA
jgi:hypothetical protein